MPLDPRIRIFDIADHADPRPFSTLWAWLRSNRRPEGTLPRRALRNSIHEWLDTTYGQRHTLDLSKVDVGEDKTLVLRAYRRRFWRRTFLIAIAYAVAVVLFYHVVPGPFSATNQMPNGPPPEMLPFADLPFGRKFAYWLFLTVPALIAYFIYRTIAYFRLRSKILALRAKEVLANDSRRPVLLIRSFQDDEAPIEAFVTRTKGWIRRRSETIIERTRFEQAIARPLAVYGPVVAVGNPLDDIPDEGAARARFSNENWKQPVIDLIAQARLIVLIAGAGDKPPAEQTRHLLASQLIDALSLTPGVRWEIEHILTTGQHKKLLVLFKPPVLRFWNRFIERRRRGFITGLFFRGPRAVGPTPEGYADLADALALHLAPDGRVSIVATGLHLREPPQYELATMIAFHEMFCTTPRAAAKSAA